jgi:hypothetical protein
MSVNAAGHEIMKFLCLSYIDEQKFEGMSESEHHAAELMSKHPGISIATFEIRALDEESTAEISTPESGGLNKIEKDRETLTHEKEMRLCPSNPI